MQQQDQHNLIDSGAGNKKSSGDTTNLFVSLYLIILAFFMVLNSISNQSQTKVKAATESVNSAFDNKYAQDADFIEVDQNEDTKLPNDEFYEQLQGVFASLIGFDKKFPTQGGNVIRVEFLQSDIYQEDSSEFRDDQNAFFFQLAQFLNSEDFGTVREIEYIIFSGDNYPAGPAYWENLSILRSGAIIKKMTSMGVREEQLSMGVAPGKSDGLKVSFFISNETTANLNLKDADRQGLGEQSVLFPGGQF